MSEVKRYRGLLLDTSPHDAPPGDMDYVLASDYDALAARVAELEKDAWRYRWLRASTEPSGFWVAHGGPGGMSLWHGADLDAALDMEAEAAMQAASPDADRAKHE